MTTRLWALQFNLNIDMRMDCFTRRLENGTVTYKETSPLLKYKLSVKLFLASITLIELSLINIPAHPLYGWIHFQHHGHMTKTTKQNNILFLDPLHGHMTKTPEQNDIHVQINNDVRTIVSLVINLI